MLNENSFDDSSSGSGGTIFWMVWLFNRIIISSENIIPSNMLLYVVPFCFVLILSENENNSGNDNEWFCGIPDKVV